MPPSANGSIHKRSMTGLLGRVSPELNLMTAFGFGVLGTLWFAWRGSCVVRVKD